jgi:hypothetical protein
MTECNRALVNMRDLPKAKDSLEKKYFQSPPPYKAK